MFPAIWIRFVVYSCLKVFTRANKNILKVWQLSPVSAHDTKTFHLKSSSMNTNVVSISFDMPEEDMWIIPNVTLKQYLKNTYRTEYSTWQVYQIKDMTLCVVF
jgi:hypothetical protein